MSDMRVEMQDRDALVAQLQAQLQQMKIAQQEQADKLDEVTREKEDLVASRSLQEQQNEKLLSEVASKEEEKKRIEMERRVHIRKMICEFKNKIILNLFLNLIIFEEKLYRLFH